MTGIAKLFLQAKFLYPKQVTKVNSIQIPSRKPKYMSFSVDNG